MSESPQDRRAAREAAEEANRAAEVSRLRAEVERLTRERDDPVARIQRALGNDDGFRVACEALIAEKQLCEKAEARVAELEKEREKLVAALTPFATCWRNFRAAPVSDMMHPRFDGIACGFDVWRNADDALPASVRGEVEKP